MVTAKNTWEEIKEAQPEIALIPIGTIEQHGRHLPVGTDWLVAEARGRELGRELGAYVLPAMPFGCSVEHMGFPGTVTLRPATLAAFLEDLVESLYRQGFRKIVVLSTHGGNWILKPTLRELNFEHPDLMLIWAHAMSAEPPPDIHAGEGETATMLHYYPELVRERREDCSPAYTQEYNDYVGLDVTTDTGVWGRPSRASAEKAATSLQGATERQVKYIRETFGRLEELRNRRQRAEQ